MATRNIVPRADGEGSVGTAVKHWGNGYFDELNTEKLVADDMINKNGIDPDAFSGNTDAEKLQNAIDYAVTKKTSTIIINRKYDITGSSLNINKRLDNSDDGLRQKLTFLGVGTGEIYKGDSGYIFTGSIPHSANYTFTAGDVSFINMKFRGSTSIQNDKSNLCSVYDCHKIIGINCFGCSYSSVGRVFDGRECISASSNAQSIRTYGDTCVNCYAYFTVKYLWDCVIHGALIENCDYGVRNEQDNENGNAVYHFHIINCCMESFVEGAIVFEEDDNYKNKYSLSGLNVENCYFEDLGKKNITLHYSYMYDVQLKNNQFSANTKDTNKHFCDLYIRNNSWLLEGNSASGDSSYTLFYISKDEGNPLILQKTNFVIEPSLTNKPNIINTEPLPLFIDGIDSAKQAYHSGIYSITSNHAVSDLPTGETRGTLYVFQYNGANRYQVFVGNRTWKIVQNNGTWSDWEPENIGSISTTVSMSPIGSGNMNIEKIGRTCTLTLDNINNLPSGESYLTDVVPDEFKPSKQYKTMLLKGKIYMSILVDGRVYFYNYDTAITTAAAINQTLTYMTK